MNAESFYSSHSPMSSPGKLLPQIAALPDDLARLTEVIHGIYIHFSAGEQYHIQHPAERLAEVNLRFAADMFARILQLDPGPLDVPRPPEKRLISYCGSASLMLISLLRTKGIACRKRVGFAKYFAGFGPSNHEIVEVWDRDTQTWRLADPHLDEVMVEHNRIDFDPLDVPADQFVVAGQAWQLCRQGKANPYQFGIGDFRGEWMIRKCLVSDLAALNKYEMLDWDNWGIMLSQGGIKDRAELDLLDEIAAAAPSGTAAFDAVITLYASHPELQVTEEFMSFSPVSQTERVSLKLPS